MKKWTNLMWIASFGIALKHLKRRPPLPKKTDTRLSFDQKRHKRFYFLKPNFTAFLMAGTLFLLLGACQQKASYEIIFVQKDETSFTATALDYRLEFTSDGIAVKSKPDIEQGSEWLIYFDGAEPEQSVLHQNEDKSAALVYQNLYPETNLHFYDKGNGRAAYDFILAPGAKVSDICLNLEGPKPPFINQYGELVLPLAEGEIRHSAPYSYQEIDGQKKIVESRFVLEDNCLSFEVGAYDQNYPLTIDPTISFAPPMPPDVFAELVGEFSSTSAEIGGEVMTLKITYGVNSNESDLSGGRIEVPLPYGLLAGGIALTSHFSGSTINPGSPSGPGSIILNFHDPVASGIAGAVYIDISFDRGTVCPGDIFPVDATLFFEGNAEASIEEFNLTALDVDQDWVLSSNFSITETCGTSCPSGYQGTLEVMVSATEYKAFQTLDLTLTQTSGADLGLDGVYPMGTAAMGMASIQIPVCPPNGTDTYAFDLDILGDPECDLSDVVLNGTAMATPAPATAAISCLGGPVLTNSEIGGSGDFVIPFRNAGSECLPEMILTIQVPPEIEIQNIPDIVYTAGGVDVQIDVYDEDGVLHFSRAHVSNDGMGAIAMGDLPNIVSSIVFTFGSPPALQIPPGFGPAVAGFIVNIPYIVRDIIPWAPGNGGPVPVIAANPRIDNINCDNVTSAGLYDAGNFKNPDGYDCLFASVNLTATGPDMMALTPCGAGTNAISRTPPEGIDNVIKEAATTIMLPGQTSTYTIRFRNCAGPTSDVEIFDILDEGLVYVPNSTVFNMALETDVVPAFEPTTAMTTDNDPEEGPISKTVLMWKFTTPFPGGSMGQNCTEEYSISFDVTVPTGMPPRVVPNCIVTDWADSGDFDRMGSNNGNHPNGMPIDDGDTSNDEISFNDGNPTETFPPFPVSGCAAGVTIPTSAEVESKKGIKGSCDLTMYNGFDDPAWDWEFLVPGSALPTEDGEVTIYPGGEFRYLLNLENTGNVNVSDMIIIDIFPFVGDQAITFESPRGSDFEVFLKEPIDIKAPFDGLVTVYYTTETNPCRPELVTTTGMPVNPVNCTENPNWSSTPPADISAVKAIKIEFNPGTELTSINPISGAGGAFNIFQAEVIMQAPIDIVDNSLVAYNVFGLQGQFENVATGGMDRTPLFQPPKVGVRVGCEAEVFIGDRVWLDLNGDGVQDPNEPGINNVTVQLFRSDDAVKDPSDELIVSQTTTNNSSGEPGYYTLSDLDPLPAGGYYYVKFDYSTANLPLGVTVSPANTGQGGMPDPANDVSNDSDGIDMGGNMAMSELFGPYDGFPGPGPEGTPDIDLGLVPNQICELIPTIRVECNDAGTPYNAADDQFRYFITVDRFIDGVLDNTGSYTVNVDIDDLNAAATIMDVDAESGIAYGVERALPDHVNNSMVGAMDGGWFEVSDFDNMNFRIIDDLDASCVANTTARRPVRLDIQNIILESVCERSGPDLFYDMLSLDLYVYDGAYPTETTLTGNTPADYVTRTADMIRITIDESDISGTPAPRSFLVALPGTPGNPSDPTEITITSGMQAELVDLLCSGENNVVVSAEFVDASEIAIGDGCNGAERYNEPCYLEITNVNVTDNCTYPGDGTYTVSATYILYNPSGNLTISTDIPGGPTNTTSGSLSEGSGNLISLDIPCQTFSPEQMQMVQLAFASNPACMDQSTFNSKLLGATLGNKVWNDLNANGIQDPGEPGVDGVEVTLYERIGAMLVPTGRTFTTSGGGMYNFDLLETGNYCVHFDISGLTVDYQFTDPDILTNGEANDSDVTDPGSADCMTADVSLMRTDNYPDLDAGIYAFDYGDLPDTGAGTGTGNYETTDANGGAKHALAIDQVVYLGAGVDNDSDGAPSNDAGEGGSTGDDGADSNDDEDGITEPVMVFQGEQATFTANVITPNGTTAYVYGYIDWNNDGNFSGTGEVASANRDSDGPVNLVFNVPLSAVPGTDLGARFRIGTVENEVNTANGLASDGEVEDYMVQVKPLDFGDLNDLTAGSGTGDYQTTYSNDGPRHGLPLIPTNAQIFLGGGVDAEADGQPDINAGATGNGDGADEDGVIIPSMFFRGEQADFTISVTTNTTAYIYGYIDWNNDGLFTGPEEVQNTSTATSGNVMLTFNVPLNAIINTDLGARFRIGSVEDEVDQANGFAMDGEVEDYLIKIKGLDFGDLPVAYTTLESEDGPRHGQPETPQVYLGTAPDTELDGQEDPNAGETGNGDGADEDGVSEPAMLFRGEEAEFSINVVNNSGTDAKLIGFIDWNNNAIFEAGEMEHVTVSGSGNVSLTFDVPLNAAIYTDLGARFRISTDPDFITNMPSDGFAMDGEVEDYLVQVKGLDFGDLPAAYLVTHTEDGPRHGLPAAPDLYLGSAPDVELDGQENPEALGDGADEDGIQLTTPLIPGYQACIEVNSTVPAATTAYLQGWMDFGSDNTFDPTDQIISNYSFTSADNGSPTEICFTVPNNGTFPGGMGHMRFRLSTEQDLMPGGFAMDGEVEDYKFRLAKVGNLVWEDRNYDGIQGNSTDEPGINGITINLTWEGPDGDISNTADNETYSVTSANVGGKDGIYYFCGLIAGEYSIDVSTNRFQTRLGFGTQFTDSNDGVNGTTVNITSVTGLTTMENGTSDMPGMINGFPNNQDDQSFDFGYTGLDWGDLPDAFGTTMANSGAVHAWKPGLYLGSCIDFETDGSADPEAGTDGTGGDDNTAGLFVDGTCATANDDEDGVTLLTPLIPGNEACVEVTATSTVGTAVLNAWIDFNGDGDFAGDANEFVVFNTVNGGALGSANGPIPNGTSTQTFCFDVPATATFDGGETHMRFRLSMNGTTNFDGLVTSGEVEDYHYPLAKIGNLVWEDYSFDGIQDTGEPGIENVTVQLTWAGPDNTLGNGDDIVYSEMTNASGNYYFCGLIASNYEVKVIDPATLTPTKVNTGNDDYDDNDYMSQVVNITDPFNLPTGEDGLTDNPGGTDGFPDASEDISVDFGFVALDFGDLPDGFVTTDGIGGPVHVIQPDFYLGDCVDPETDGNPDDEAGTDGTGGDDTANSNFGQGTCNAAGDENGIAFITPMVPGHTACIEVTSTIPTGGGLLNAWIDFNGNDVFDAGEEVLFTSIGGTPVTPTADGNLPAGNQVTEMCFTIPSTAAFEGEETHLRFRLSSGGGLLPVGLAGDGEVEDYYLPMAKLGNFVWEDLNGNGIQDNGEPGIGGITVTLDATDANGDPYQATVTTLPNGYYSFCGLLPTADMSSPYKLTFDSPGANWITTAQDSPVNFGITGDDTNDSDVDPNTLMITNIVLGDTENNPTLDAGFLVLAELGDYVWLDFDNGFGEDGEQQSIELPVENAKLTLTGTDGLGRAVMLMQNTGSMGEYLFENLWPGDYLITIDVSMITGPPELAPYANLLIFTSQDATGDNLDSDVDPGNYDSPVGNTPVYNLESQESELTVDGGILVPCLPPTDLMADNIMIDMFTLSWQVHNNPITGIDVTDHCWNIEVGANGFAVGMGQEIVELTVCEWEPGVTVIGDRVYYDVQGLQPGTCYDAYVAETCDGFAPPPNTMGWTMNAISFCTYDNPPVGSYVAAAPSCPMISPGYMDDGSFVLTIQDGASCPGSTYDVTVTAVPDSAPDGGTPPLPTPVNLNNVPAGMYNFTNAGAGIYQVSITEVGPCLQKPDLTPVLVNVLVPDAIDSDPPSKTVTDLLGNNVTAIGPFNLPEGVCQEEVVLFVQGMDSCDGMIIAADAVTASAVTLPASIDPGTQVSVTPDGMGNYMVNINFSVGTTTLTIGLSDAFGNVTEMQYTVVVTDNVDAQITPGPANFNVPVCEDEIEIVYSFNIHDGCDDEIDPANVSFTANGSETLLFSDPDQGYFEYSVTVSAADDASNWTIEYTDDFGNVFTQTPTVTVTELSEDYPPVIITADEVVTIPACEATTFMSYSFTVMDDCDEIVLADITFDDDGAGLSFSSSYPAGGNNAVTLTYQGQVAPGTYFPLISYQGQQAQPSIIVEQVADQAASIDMPGNLTFTLPICEGESVMTLSVQIYDDCDNPIGNAVFTLDGEEILPSFSNGNGYFEFTIPITAANNGSILAAEYTDGAGNESFADALITVHSALDTWSPIVVYPSNFLHAEIDHCDASTAQVCFEVSATDNCSGDMVPEVVITPEPENLTIIPGVGGYTYCMEGDAGFYSVDISATDDAGNTTVEDFTIVITENEVGQTNLACNNNLHITLNDDCQAVVVPDMLLDGNFGCLTEDDFEIVIIDGDPSNGNILDGCGQFAYEIRLADGVEGNFTMCWGYITSEDKTDPVVVCPDDTGEVLVQRPVQYLSGSLDAGDASLNLPFYSCFLELTNPPIGTHHYELRTFTVSQTDIYTFDLATSWGDGIGALYEGNFNVDQPCSNIIAQSDDVVGPGPFIFFQGVGAQTLDFDALFRLALPLQAGQTYTLLTTSWPTDATGDYTWAVYGDNGGRINGVPVSTETIVYDLICEDLNYILIEGESYTVSADGTIVSISSSLAEKLSYTGFPDVMDNCGDVLVTVSDTYIEYGDCGDVVVTRTFEVEDKVNSDCTGAPNSAYCTQTITLRKPTIEEVIFPPLTVSLECDENIVFDDNGNPHPLVSGYPFIPTAFGFHSLDQTYCNLGASYSDEPRVSVCEGTYKIRREWNLLDWCNPGENRIISQLVKVGDHTAPTMSCPIVDWNQDGIHDGGILTYSTSPFDCTAGFEAPLPEVFDNCSSWEVLTQIVTDVEEEILNQYGQVIGTQTVTQVLATIQPDAPHRYVGGIPIGCHRFRYTASDACGNSSVMECDFCVEDQIEPTAICDDVLFIAINGGGNYSRVYVEDIDEGSHDNCGEVSLHIRRLITRDANCNPVAPYFTDWSSHIDFSCCDVGELITIELRATDEAGNTNICWLEVPIVDNVAPTCIAPHDVSIGCDVLPYGFDPQDTEQLQTLFGVAETADNCSADWEELPPLVNLDDCGNGAIIRRFRAVDSFGNNSGNSCTQVVSIEAKHNYEIKFPKDAVANCGIVDPGEVEYSELSCDLIAVSTTDEFFSASGEECYKIIRTHRVINWCEYDGISAPVVITRNEDCNIQPGDDDVWVLVRSNGITYVDRDNNEFNNDPFFGTSRCTNLPKPQGHWANSSINTELTSVGFWQYAQFIKVYDDKAPTVSFEAPAPFCSINSYTCKGSVEYPFNITEECTPQDLTITVYLDANADGVRDGNVTSALSGTYPNYVLTGSYPIGNHAFEVEVSDGCGNTNAAVLPFQVVDCLAPAPICINGLAIELMPVEPDTDADGDGDYDLGAMDIWATDFIASPNPDCSGPVTYSINRVGETADQNNANLILTCDDLGNSVLVEIYAWDNAYNPYAVQPDGILGGPNYDHCVTYVLVQDNMFNVCNQPGPGMIAGALITEEGEALEGSTVYLSGASSQNTETGTNGAYAFNGLEIGYDYTIAPSLDENPLNGVSTLDMIFISKHILGVTPLDSPYKLIAADINKSRTISTLDLIQLRKLILSVDLEFANNTSWRFVRADYVFPDPSNPWAESFPEIININDLAEPMYDQNFVAIKVGDVNGNAQANNLFVPEERSSPEVFAFEVMDIELEKGQIYEVGVQASDIELIQGYQFTLQFDTEVLELEDMLYAQVKAENFGWRFLEEGMITTSWNEQSGTAVPEEALFGLRFKAKKSGRLSEVIGINSRYLSAEAYNRDGDLIDLAIDFGSETPAAGYELYQNNPNPFADHTRISFYLPEADQATLQIMDINGRLLKVIDGDFARGINHVDIQSGQLPASGVLYYTLKTGDFTATKSMILIE